LPFWCYFLQKKASSSKRREGGPIINSPTEKSPKGFTNEGMKRKSFPTSFSGRYKLNIPTSQISREEKIYILWNRGRN